MLLAASCPGCLAVGPAPCPRCVDELSLLPLGPVPDGVDSIVSLFVYEGVGARLIQRLKYSNHRDALKRMCAALAEQLRPKVEPGTCTVTWVPTTAGRRRGRGFDQAELAARDVARRLGCQSQRLLDRPEEPPQTGRARRERLVGPGFTVAARVAPPCDVVLVDDVVTTGASLAAAAAALRQSGATRIFAGTLAATPSRFGQESSTIASTQEASKGNHWCRSE